MHMGALGSGRHKKGSRNGRKQGHCPLPLRCSKAFVRNLAENILLFQQESISMTTKLSYFANKSIRKQEMKQRNYLSKTEPILKDIVLNKGQFKKKKRVKS